MVLDAALLCTQHYKVKIKSKNEQYWELSWNPRHFGVIAIEKAAFGLLSTKVPNFTYKWYVCIPESVPENRIYGK